MVTIVSLMRHVEKAHLRVGLLLLMLACCGLFAQSALGHAALVSVTPADGSHLDTSPAEIVLEFNEPVGIVDNGTMLFQQNADKQILTPMVHGNVVHIPIEVELGDGAYVVQWRVISADSHPITGTVSFTIGDTRQPLSVETDTLPGWVENARVTTVTVKYLGLLAAIGVLVFGFLLARDDWAPIRNLTTWLFAFAIVGALIEIPFAAMIQAGRTIGVGQKLWDAYLTLDGGFRASAYVLVLMLVVGMAVGRLRIHPQMRMNLSLALAVGAALSQTLSGHSRTKEPVWLMMVSDSIHIVVAGIWLGGLLVLALGFLGRWKGSTFATEEDIASIVWRFSTLAGWSLLLVAASGVTMAVTIVGSWDVLFNTDYGVTLLVKTALVGMVVCMASLNRFLLVPRTTQSPKPTLPWLKRLVTCELIVLLIVVGITARLVQLNPNVESVVAEQGFQTTLYSGESKLDADHSVHIMVEQVSLHRYHVTAHLLDPEGDMTQAGKKLNLSWFLPEQGLGPIVQVLEMDADSVYMGEVTLPLAGNWLLEIRASFDRFTDSRATVEVAIPN